MSGTSRGRMLPLFVDGATDLAVGSLLAQPVQRIACAGLLRSHARAGIVSRLGLAGDRSGHCAH